MEDRGVIIVFQRSIDCSLRLARSIVVYLDELVHEPHGLVVLRPAGVDGDGSCCIHNIINIYR